MVNHVLFIRMVRLAILPLHGIRGLSRPPVRGQVDSIEKSLIHEAHRR